MKKRFTGHTRLFLGISGLIVVVALVMQICGVGLNLGIDFTGGSILEYSVGEDYDANDVETILASVGYTDAQITKAAPSAASIALQAGLTEEAESTAEPAQSTVAPADETAAETTAEPAESTTAPADETATESTAAPADETAEETTAEPTDETAAETTAEPTAETTAETTQAPEEEAAAEPTQAPSLLNPDKSGIVSDGLTDLQIRLRLVDEAADMESSAEAAVKGVVSGAVMSKYAQITYQSVTDNGYDDAFTGGYVLEFDMGGTYDLAAVESAVNAALDADGYSINQISFSAYAPEEGGEETGLRILVDLDDMTSQVRTVLEQEMRAKYPGFHFVTIDHVSAIAGRDLLGNAVKALLIAFVCMLIYIAIRFDPLSGLAALFALLHDVLVMLAFMVFFRNFFQVNSSFIAAVLTIIGYSINNTIIIFDRIRENLKRPGYTQKPRVEIVELSVSSTLSRTINTTVTTLITLVCVYIFGVESIREFAFPLIVGMVAGTYSSVLLSGQVWASWSEKLAKTQKA